MSGRAEKVRGRFPRLVSWMRYLKGKMMEDEPATPEGKCEGTTVERMFQGQAGSPKPCSVLEKARREDSGRIVRACDDRC